MHGDVREELQDVGHGEVQANLGAGVAALQKVLDILVLPYKLLLHGAPHHLTHKNKKSFYLFHI